MFRPYLDSILKSSCGLAALCAFLLLGGLLLFLGNEASSAVYELGFLRFLQDHGWYPDAAGEGSFGLAPMLGASLLLGILSCMIAVPLALLLVLYRRFYASRVVSSLLQAAIELLGGIPSVVIGLAGLVVMVPWIASIASPGSSLLAGVLVLVPMILPTAALLLDSRFERIAMETYLSSAALGLSRATLAFRVLVPGILPSIVMAGSLAFARAIGETMAVVMVTGNVVQLPGSLFDPVRALPSNIALEMPYALGVHRQSLFLSGLLIAMISLCVVPFTRFFMRKQKGVV